MNFWKVRRGVRYTIDTVVEKKVTSTGGGN